MASGSDDSGLRFQVNFTELFNDDFMRANTKFQTMQEMLDSACIESVDDLNGESFGRFVASNTRFSSWQEMYTVASEIWTASKYKELE